MAIDPADEDEYATDSDEDDEDDEEKEEEVHMKPIFIPKAFRQTIKENEARTKEEEEFSRKKKSQLEMRKQQTRVMVADSLRRIEELKEMQAAEAVDSDAGLPDDTDDVDDELEYEAWKVRELARLKRDADERETAAKEATELQRRRNMTDEERLEEDRRLGLIKGEGEEKDSKPKWKYLQKYFHKGVFYLDSTSVKDPNDVRTKDYAAEPTLEDKIDKEKLPQVLQVKNFGKRGRTKYTHLLDQDTTIDKKSKKRIDVRADKDVEALYTERKSGLKKIK